MDHKVHNVGAAEKIGRYSDAIEAAPGLRWLHTSGTPGVLDDGTFPAESKPKRASPGNIFLRCSRKRR